MKVHFAGHTSFKEALAASGVRYVLDTFYEIGKLKGERAQAHIDLMNSYNHAIIDSGLFTLMFGAKAGTEITEDFIEDWQNDYANFVNTYGFKHSIVECDVQKVLSADFAWEMRKKFRTQIKDPNVTIINAYHLEDENPDKLIDYADYIAVSQPELRIHTSRKERYRITEYICTRAYAKGKRIHLLGCTEKKMMRDFSYCFSCDSTSWMAGAQYNKFYTELNKQPGSDNGKIDINLINENHLPRFTTKGANQAYWQAAIKRMEYAKYAGNQD